MSYAQFGYTAYPSASPHQLLSVATSGSTASGPSSPTSCIDSSIPRNRPTSLTSPMVSPVSPTSNATAQQAAAVAAAAYESRFLTSAAYHHHHSVHPVHHPHQVHPRLAAGFYGSSGNGSTGATGIAYAADATSSTGGYQSLTTVDASAFYPTLGGGYSMKDDPWRGSLTSASHNANPHHQAASYYYDPTLAAYGYGGLDFNGARRKNVTRDSTTTLKAWLGEHRKNPYPTKGEKIMLAIITKMTLTQVSTWFANARRRLKKENKMTWEPRNKVDSDDQPADEKTNGTDSSRRSGSVDTCQSPKTELSLDRRNAPRRESVKSDGEMDSDIEDDSMSLRLRNDPFQDRRLTSLSCINKTPFATTMGAESSSNSSRGNIVGVIDNHSTGRLPSLSSIHGSYISPGPIISDPCIQLPFSTISNSAPNFQHHSSLPNSESRLSTSSSIPYQNRLQSSTVSDNNVKDLTGLPTTASFTPSASSSSESDSPDLLNCSALDALIKDTSSASSSPSSSRDAHSDESSGSISSPIGDVTDSPFSPVTQKPKIWSLAATATSKSPPPPQQHSPMQANQHATNSCSHFEGNVQQQHHYQHHQQQQHKDFCMSYGSGSAWYAAYHHHHHNRHQIHQVPFQHSGFGHYSASCGGGVASGHDAHGSVMIPGSGFSPAPPQTDTPPQTPPNVKVTHSSNYGQGQEHHQTNYLQHLNSQHHQNLQQHSGQIETNMMMMCDLQNGNQNMEKPNVMENSLYTAGLDIRVDQPIIAGRLTDSSSPRLQSDGGSSMASSSYGDCFQTDSVVDFETTHH